MNSSTYFSNPEARAFLQRRVATFGLIGAILGGTALTFRVVMGLLFSTLEEQVGDPGFWIHAAAILPMLAVWAICRRGAYSVNQIHGIENTGIFLTSLGYVGMGLDIRPEVGADTITAFILALLLFARSVFVPSSARRTLVLGVSIGIPLVAAMYWHYLHVDLSIWKSFGYPARSDERVAASQAVITVMWWTLTVGLSALAGDHLCIGRAVLLGHPGGGRGGQTDARRLAHHPRDPGPGRGTVLCSQCHPGYYLARRGQAGCARSE